MFFVMKPLWVVFLFICLVLAGCAFGSYLFVESTLGIPVPTPTPWSQPLTPECNTDNACIQ